MNYYLLLLFTFFLTTHTFGQQLTPVEIPFFEDEVFIPSSKILLLEDPDNNTEISDILIGPDDKFQTPQEDMLLFSKDVKSYWVKLQIKGKPLGMDQWFFELPDSHVGSVKAYVQVGKKPVIYAETGGYDHDFGKRKFKHKNIIFPITGVESGEDEVVTIFLKYNSEFNNVLFYKLSRSNRLFVYSITEYILLGINYGILICLLIATILLLLTLKDKDILFITAFLLASFLIDLSEDNLASQYLFDNHPHWNYILMRYSSTLSMLSIVALSMNVLKIRKKSFKTYLTIWGITLLNTFYFVVFKSFNDSLWQMPTFMIPFVIIFFYMLLDIKRSEMKVTYFFLGYLVIIAGLSLQVLRAYEIFISHAIIVVYSYNVGLLLTGLFMTLGQFQRFKILKEEKEQAQGQLIKNLQVREKIIEDKVQERTEEIAKQKEIIALKNDELQWVNDQLNEHRKQIQEMNAQLKVENEQLHEDVEQLESARVLMQEVTFDEFEKMFPSDESCYAYLEEIKWKNGFKCKKCENDTYAKGAGVNSRRCKKCNYNESVTAGTLFHRLHFPIQKAFYMVFIVFAKDGDISSTKLSEILEMRQNTCWKFAKKIKETMQVKTEELGSKEKLKHKGWEELILKD
ncbi:7TM diverse intracellular signaling domain-containing protein [Flammeovirga aprica]|uniref:Chromosome partitioning protein ParA n=1 Tax=Flammeovirga aprica JL-4 TaxID=694437 RepID=A0A7X9RSB7_9BACT|nr:7TM diverse intracellular signaling domain-containing protein [Flammeovirga aprica]NME66826.1 hypothetical protein [Flammeovirga aprica JL-4]